MSAPDTRLSRQKRRHRGPLIGIAAVVAVALILFLWMIGRETDELVAPEPAPATEGEALVPPQTDDSQVIAPGTDGAPGGATGAAPPDGPPVTAPDAAPEPLAPAD